MAVPTTGSGCARAQGVCRPRCPYYSSQRWPRGRMLDLAPLRAARDSGARLGNAGDASRVRSDSAPADAHGHSRMGLAARLAARSAAPHALPPAWSPPGLRGLAGEPDQWSAASSPTPAPGLRGQWQRSGRAAPSRGSQPPAPPSRHRGPQRPSSRLVSGLRPPRPGAWGLPSRRGSHQLPGIRDAPSMEGDRKLPELARRSPATPSASSRITALPDAALKIPGAASEPTRLA